MHLYANCYESMKVKLEKQTLINVIPTPINFLWAIDITASNLQPHNYGEDLCVNLMRHNPIRLGTSTPDAVLLPRKRIWLDIMLVARENLTFDAILLPCRRISFDIILFACETLIHNGVLIPR